MSNYTATLPQRQAIRATIIAKLQSGPKTSEEIREGTDMEGNMFSNVMAVLLRTGEISRVQLTAKRYRYYIGQTSPEPYTPAGQKAPKRTVYSIPVKTVVVSPFSIAGEDGKSYNITMPAAPWEVRA